MSTTTQAKPTEQVKADHGKEGTCSDKAKGSEGSCGTGAKKSGSCG